MNKKFYLIALFFLFTIAIFSQTTYYVSSSKGSDSNSGKSSSSPWKSMNKLNSTKFYPGDKILFQKGDSWIGQWSLQYSGTSSQPIYIGNFGSGSAPIISGNNSLAYLLRLYDDVKYVTIEEIYFKDCDPDGSGGINGLIYGTSNNSNIIINNCTFSQAKASNNADYALIYMKDPSYLTIENCDLSGKSQAIHLRSNYRNHRDVHHITIKSNNIHDISDWALGRGIRFSSYYATGVGSTIGQEGIVRDITISDNKFTKIGSTAIFHEDIQNSSGTAIWLEAGKTSYNINILRNTVYLVEWGFIDWGRITDRNGKFGWSYVAGNKIDHCGFDFNSNVTTRYPTNAINTHAWNDVFIEDNVVTTVGTNSGDGKAIILDHSSSISASGVRTVYPCDGVVVRRNIVSGCRYGSTGYGGGIHIYDGTNCKIYNNVSFNNESGITIEGKNSTNNLVYNNTCDGNDAGFWFGSIGVGNLIKNNIFSNNKNYGIKNNTNLVYDYNCFYNNGKDYLSGSYIAHDVRGNPKYANASNHNYQLLSGSVAIDKGTTITGLSTDILGNLVKGNVDIGAYQYSSGSTSSVPSAPSLNSPSNGSTDISTSPTLTWNSSTGATSYSLQVSTSSSFNSFVLNLNNITSNSNQLTNLSENTKYYWRVNAQNSSGTSSWSSIYSFTTQGIITPPTPNGNFISINSENGTLSGDAHFKVKSGSISSKVAYFLNTSSYIQFNLTLDKAGQWYAWGRMFFESSGSPCNSFYIQVDNGTKLTFGNSNFNYDKWNWEGYGTTKLPIGNLSAGTHTIRVYGREARETVMLDVLLLTPDENFIPSDNVKQSNNGTMVFAAENAQLINDAAFRIKAGSIGQKVAYCPNTSSQIKFSFNVTESGSYYAWGRMYFESSGNPRNSFYLQVDNGPKLTFGNSNNSYDKWHWEGHSLIPLPIGTLTAGNHTITVSGREAYITVMLNQLLITNDAYFVPTDNNVTFSKPSDSTNYSINLEEPSSYKLSQNYPNPFNPSTTISFSVPKDGMVSLKVYNILGAQVASLVDEVKSTGTYNIKFDASNLASGIYLYKLITPDYVQTKKMILVK